MNIKTERAAAQRLKFLPASIRMNLTQRHRDAENYRKLENTSQTLCGSVTLCEHESVSKKISLRCSGAVEELTDDKANLKRLFL